MAEKKVEQKVEKTTAKEAKVTEKEVVATPVAANDAVVEERRRKHTIIWVIVVGFVLLVILVMLLLVTFHRQYDNNAMRNNNGFSQNAPSFRGHGWNQVQVTTSSSSTDGPTTTTTQTTYTLTQGVVTATGDNTLTVAGNGKAQKIATNSSTTYVDDQKPQTNDSVAVWGTTDSKGNITATRVEVINN